MIYILYAVAAIWVTVGALILWGTWTGYADGYFMDYLLGIVLAVGWPLWLGFGIAAAWREEKKMRLLKQPIKPIDQQDF